MKKFLVLAVLFAISQFAVAQKKEWAALEKYHKVMATTFHPAEDGDMKPIMTRSGELAGAAKSLAKSPIPAGYQKEGVADIVKKLDKESATLHKMVTKKKSEEDIKKALFALHDRFHELMGACDH
jgi:hypothetical protein